MPLSTIVIYIYIYLYIHTYIYLSIYLSIYLCVCNLAAAQAGEGEGKVSAVDAVVDHRILRVERVAFEDLRGGLVFKAHRLI